jgi:hypothetical protein
MADAEDDKIGYKHPPERTRFKPGQSGNPKGRPRLHRNLETDLREELAERIPIRENGKQVRVTKQRAFLKSVVARAVQGDARAVNALINLCARTFLAGTNDSEVPTSSDDQELVDSFIRREAARTSKSNAEPDDSRMGK